MPLPIALPLLLAGPVAEVRLADVDGDGVDEIVVASRDLAEGPSALTLTIARLRGDTLVTETKRLPPKALWWDAGDGLWVVDHDGLRDLDGNRLLAVPTPLPTGPATAGHATLVADLDGDGHAELLVWTRDAVTVVGTDGVRWGQVAAPAEAALEARSVAGGQVLATTLTPPPVAAADVDGDGVLDLLVVHRSHVAVHRVASKRIAPAERWPLPAVLGTASGDPSTVTDVHWTDMNGDGRVDLLVHRVRSDGRLSGTEAELHLFVGSGRGLGPPQVIHTGAGSERAFPVDLDGDGDLDVLVPRVDLDLGTLARALLSQTVRVTLAVHPMTEGRLGAAVELFEVPLPMDGADAAWSMFEDHDGDGRIDLATAIEGEVTVYPGRGLAPPGKAKPVVAIPRAPENLWARDLNGDGVAELVGWSRGARAVIVVRLQ